MMSGEGMFSVAKCCLQVLVYSLFRDMSSSFRKINKIISPRVLSELFFVGKGFGRTTKHRVE